MCSRHHCKRQYGAVWSMVWDTHNRSTKADSPPLKRLATVFREISAFLRQQETHLPPAELWCACSLLIRRYICSSAGAVISNRPPVLLQAYYRPSSFK
ncbi:hypothetical protein TNCV_3712401 [Trichonephila clavipes]|nr:hypothetical protein TNCV_3712401 [Trichonephila clavipes]